MVDQASVLVAFLVFVVFGFLFGNIALYSYAQKNSENKPRKKIGAKKRKMMIMKAGQRTGAGTR